MDALDGDMKDVQKFLEESYKVNVFDVFNEIFMNINFFDCTSELNPYIVNVS